jgi:glutamate synthase (NADPH) large chain
MHPRGLYHPSFEHDACGMGFIVSLKAEKTHQIVLKGLEILKNLQHRGASGCDRETGDGAGVLIQIPHELFARDFALPEPGKYGVGMLFLPRDPDERARCEAALQKIAGEEDFEILGWRDTPVNANAIGRQARETRPYIKQVFLRPLADDDLERKLYVLRKRIEGMFYIPSMSSRTIVYKGLLLAPQIAEFYSDLADPATRSALAMVHQRFSTNTFPSWALAHPYRFLCHNGEINTVRGNVNWMNARESVLESPYFDVRKIWPVITPGASDTASLDNAVEMLTLAGRSLPHVIAMLIPEAWNADPAMTEEKRAFYEYHASLMEPWDGPAAVAFTDGRWIGATLDRNGLRPARYLITNDDHLILASETGVLSIASDNVREKGRLQPGKMLLVNLEERRLIPDEEIKHVLAARNPYAEWLAENQITLDALPQPPRVYGFDQKTIVSRQRAFGYTEEDLRILISPMAENGEEPTGSMGVDTPLACLSNRPQMLFHYFKQLFAQVTNPAIDPIREELVMSLTSYIGTERNILEETPQHCHTLKIEHPILTNLDLEKLRRVSWGDFLATTLPALFRVEDGERELERSLDSLCRRASLAIRDGYRILILSDRGLDEDYAPIPSLLALTAVHNHLVRERTRTQVALIVESGEPREVMHFALLIGYGASAVNPYLAIETLEDLADRGRLGETSFPSALKNYKKAIDKGLLKIFSKMGISTLQSYRGAQCFEAIGLNRKLIDRYFTGTPSRIEGVGLDVLAREASEKHGHAFRRRTESETELDFGGEYQFRAGGEYHLLNPVTVSKLQHAVRSNRYETFQGFTDSIDRQNRELCTLRGLMEFKPTSSVPIEEVEPASEIVKRFTTGAMSFGSISKEAHETLAVAMNRMGGRSNTGEGGEDEARYGTEKRSSIKQVASGRFGVTAHYLVNADELQIKIAQGAKPGEGGQLPGHKVDETIARVRHSIPGVPLISPPPHHDIYSIEDLAQLIYDLKCVNPRARVSVKLVAEAGVGTVAAGVAKAHADVILISGHDGGTGASPLTSIRHAGVPWELGLAETQQTLVMNELRSRVILQTDGKLQTGRDVAIAALLGAEEFGFSTAPLVAMGCIMMRKCHLNTCAVGIATQDPVLRARFTGTPEHVINYFFFVAGQLREWMARLGFRRVEEMIGRVDLIEMRAGVEHFKARGLDFSQILHRPEAVSTGKIAQDHGIEDAFDHALLPLLDGSLPVEVEMGVRNVDRSVGAMLSGEIARRFGAQGLPPESIRVRLNGSAGQSLGAFLTRGVTLELEGDANDYTGKGLSGGKLIVRPPAGVRFRPEENILIGNVALYGATSGEAFFNGRAGERFAVRNSGVTAVVEGVGDHGCEYMTKGLVIVLGETGKNFAAGMTGGIAYVLDESGRFAEALWNRATVELEGVDDEEGLRYWVVRHAEETGSPLANRILEDWDRVVGKFVKVMPKEYRRVLSSQSEKAMANG